MTSTAATTRWCRVGAHWSLEHQPATIVMPTGTGKTETMLAALAAFGRSPLLVVVPWDALRAQTAQKFLTFGLLRKLKVLPESVSVRGVPYCAASLMASSTRPD